MSATVNHEAARRARAAQERSDIFDDRRFANESVFSPEKYAKLKAVKTGGAAVAVQSLLHGPFLPKVAPAWAISGLGGDVDEKPARIAEAARFAEAEADFAAVAEEETGLSVSPEEWARQKAERGEIRRQTHKLAEMLETAGVNAYRNDAFSLWVWYVHSRTAEAIPGFRRICFLPYVAAIVRSSKLAALEFFLQCNPFCRLWTFTSGQRVGISGLGERIAELHGRLNRLNKELRKRFGVEMVFRSTELGTVEFDAENRAQGDAGGVEFDAEGNPLFHPHAHTVINSLVGYIPPKKWDAMISFVWAHWGNHWDAGQIIRNPRECCKYVTKPGDMLKLSPAQLAGVYEQLSGKRLVAPLGTLKREIAARKAAGKVLRRKRTPDGIVWREAFDQNKYLEQEAADREAVFKLHQAEAIERIDAKQGYLGEGSLRRLSDHNVCRVLARQAPAVGPLGMKEPRVIVGGTVLDVGAIENHPLVARLWSGTVQAWEAGRAIRVHTGTPTGFSEPLKFYADVPDRSKPPSEPVFAGEN